MEWVSPCLWKLNLFLNCWKVRQTRRVTQEARWKCIVNKCLSAEALIFWEWLPCLWSPQPLPRTSAWLWCSHSGRLPLWHLNWPITVVHLKDWTWDTDSGECSVSLGQCTWAWNSGPVELRCRARWSAPGRREDTVWWGSRGSRFTSCLIYKLCDTGHKL